MGSEHWRGRGFGNCDDFGNFPEGGEVRVEKAEVKDGGERFGNDVENPFLNLCWENAIDTGGPEVFGF